MSGSLVNRHGTSGDFGHVDAALLKRINGDCSSCFVRSMRKPALCVFSVLFKRNKIIGKKDIFTGEDALVPPHRSVLRSVA